MKKKTKRVVWLGILCGLLMGVSSWYSITFNEGRWVVPMDFSEYVFRVGDLPMMVSLLAFVGYILYLVGLFLGAVLTNRSREREAQTTRAINPKLGFLGFLGFLGLLGFWSYGLDKTVTPFTFFVFFGFFGFFYEGKMSGTFMDERYRENRGRAQLTAMKTALSILFLALIILGQGRLFGHSEYALIAMYITVALSLALELFLCEYLLYRYDSRDMAENEEEP